MGGVQRVDPQPAVCPVAQEHDRFSCGRSVYPAFGKGGDRVFLQRVLLPQPQIFVERVEPGHPGPRLAEGRSGALRDDVQLPVDQGNVGWIQMGIRQADGGRIGQYLPVERTRFEVERCASRRALLLAKYVEHPVAGQRVQIDQLPTAAGIAEVVFTVGLGKEGAGDNDR